jgi:hypothetical protein
LIWHTSVGCYAAQHVALIKEPGILGEEELFRHANVSHLQLQTELLRVPLGLLLASAAKQQACIAVD